MTTDTTASAGIEGWREAGTGRPISTEDLRNRLRVLYYGGHVCFYNYENFKLAVREEEEALWFSWHWVAHLHQEYMRIFFDGLDLRDSRARQLWKEQYCPDLNEAPTRS